jgi:hypothetical protein
VKWQEPTLFADLADAAPIERAGTYSRELPPEHAARAKREMLEIDLGAAVKRAEAEATEQPADRFAELSAVVLRARDLISDRKFASAEAHLRTIIERLNLKEGANQ